MDEKTVASQGSNQMFLPLAVEDAGGSKTLAGSNEDGYIDLAIR